MYLPDRKAEITLENVELRCKLETFVMCFLQLAPSVGEVPFLLDAAHVLTHLGHGLPGRLQGASENLLYLGINA